MSGKIDSSDMEDLVETWKVLNGLTVSMRRIGQLWITQNQEVAAKALQEYMNPYMFEQIAASRRRIYDLLNKYDTNTKEKLDSLPEEELEKLMWGN